MQKRNTKQITKDLKAIKEAAKTAKTLKDIATVTGLSYSKVVTSLSNHPIIKKRVLASLEANKGVDVKKVLPHAESKTPSAPIIISSEDNGNGKFIVICDCPALMYGLRNCSTTPIVIPKFVENSLIGIAKSDSFEGHKAKMALTKIEGLSDWCTVVPNPDEDSFVELTDDFSWRAQTLVALACKYWSDGYHVTVKTRTAEIYKFATLQGCLTVDFVPADDELIG